MLRIPPLCVNLLWRSLPDFSITMNRRPKNYYASVTAILAVCLLNACSRPDRVEEIPAPTEREFESLFVLEDTIRLDDAVLIGRVSTLDVNSKGELLVLDRQGEAIHVFSPRGTHLRTLSITDCNPEATVGFRAMARYLDDFRVIALTTKGAMVFDEQGHCIQTTSDREFVTSAYSVCQREDTILVMPDFSGDSIYIRAYSPEFALLDQFPLPLPRFPIRARVMNANQGYTMGCYTDDVWWFYGSDHDARPRLEGGGLRRYNPPFFRERKEDWSELPTVTPTNFEEITQKIGEYEKEASSITALFELGESTRMVEYLGVSTTDEERRGILVVSHEDAFGAAIAYAPESIEAAAYGMVYFVDVPEDEAGDNPSNPLVRRYRFIPPVD